MEKLDQQLYIKLASLDRDELYDALKQSGVIFTDAKREDLSKEELLLVADEANLKILQSFLEKFNVTERRA